MKKSIKIIITILIVLIILLGGLYYFLLPSEKISLNNNNRDKKPITTEEIFKDSSVEKFELLKDPLRVEGIISMPNKSVENIIYTVMSNSNSEDMNNAQIQIINDRIKIVSPYKVLGFIDSQCEAYIDLSVKNNNLIANLNDVKVGKIKVNKSLLKLGLKKYKNATGLKVEDNKIIIDQKSINPLLIKKVTIKNKNVILNIEIKAENVIDFLKNSHVGIVG